MLHIARFDDLKPGAAHGLGHVGGVPQPRRILRPGDVPIGLGSRMADQKEPASLRDPRGQAGHKAGHRELGLVQEGDEHEIHRRARLPPAHIFFILTVVQCLVAGCTINALAALGEETGWRGWLLSALSPLGTTRAVVFTGAVWGLWHAPLIAMGYEYEHQIPAALGIVLFTMFCMAFGTLLAWLRARSGSIWPAAITHGTLNAFATLPFVLVAPEDSWDLVTSSIAGGPAILMIMAVAAILLSRQCITLTSSTHPEAPDNMT